MRPEFHDMIDDIMESGANLTDWEDQFIDDMTNVEDPSEGQYDKVRQIWEKVHG